MDEFPGILSRDFGLRPQGKAAPMMSSAPKRPASGSASGFGSGAFASAFPGDLLGGDSRSSTRRDDSVDDLFFGGAGTSAPPPKYASAGASTDPFFSMGAAKTGSSPSPTVDAGFSSPMPVYDKPVYDDDDDIFSGVPGMKKSSSASARAHSDVFAPPVYEDDLLASLGGSRPASRGSGDNGPPAAVSGSASPPYGGDDDLLGSFGRSGGNKVSEAAPNRASPPYDDDLLAGFGGGGSYGDDKRSGGASSKHSPPPYEDDLLGGLGGAPKRSGDENKSREQGVSDFDELIPGFGGSSPPKQKSGQSESKHQKSSVSSTKSTVTMSEDPFVVLESTSAATYSSSGLFTDPLEQINKPSGSMKSDVPSAKVGGLFDGISGFDGFMKSMPSFSSDIEDSKDRSPLETSGKASARESSMKPTDNIFSKTVPDDKSHQTPFEKPIESLDSFKSVHRNGLNLDGNASPHDANSGVNATQKPEEQTVLDDDVWLTVSEIHLFTRPTNALPPSRPPPAFRTKQASFSSQGECSSVGLNARRKVTESSFQQPAESYLFQNSHYDVPKQSAVSSLDELEEFAMGKPQSYSNEAQCGEEENEANSTAAASAAAMKEAMDRAEVKFKHAREVRERERDLKSSKNRETTQQVRDEDEKEKEKMDRERVQREREEREQRRLEKMRELELEREREREKARLAVERATREARERAAAEARQKAEKAAREHAERAAVQRAQAEARERAAAGAKERAERLASERERTEAEARERAARERAAERERAEAEARERAAGEARERAARERAAVEAREKAERAAVERAAAEARARAQRAAVERVTAEARERAAAEARERAAAMAREKQQKNENNLNFFGMGARATSAPKERSTPSESAFDAQFQNKVNSDGNRRTASVSSSNMKRPSSTTNIMDDLTSVFRTSSYEEFQEVEGEPEERRRARLEREQRARQRATKALAEKNEREMQIQWEQAERDRIADTLNVEIRRWAAGKEGNLRALLSTLQYVLWPDSGWQPVSLTDLITAASVKKVYRKATLCVHPDKVVNGTVQQKYIAEKVFDLLKEAWNKLNSEELF